MRTIYLVRHAESTGTRYNRHEFSKEGAPLSAFGEQQATSLHKQFEVLGVNFDDTVATSQLMRTQQTSKLAGFKNRVAYKELNEIEHRLPKDAIEALITARKVTPAALDAAKLLLQNPPPESIWFTHGMLIAAIAELLDISKDQLFIPDMASINEIEIP